MQIALVVDISVTRSELVVAHRAGFPRPVGARPREALVLGHDRLAKRLTVDRPGRAVIVRLAFLGALIDMAEDAEAELGILVENLPLRPGLGQVLTDELRIGARLLDESADLFAALGPGLGGEDAVTIGRELFERIGHRLILLSWIGERNAEPRVYAATEPCTRPPGGSSGHPSGAARCPPAGVRLGSRRNCSQPSRNGSRPRAPPCPAARLLARAGANCAGDSDRRSRAVDSARFCGGAGLGGRPGDSVLADLLPAANSGLATDRADRSASIGDDRHRHHFHRSLGSARYRVGA